MSEVQFHNTGLTQTTIALYDLAKAMAWAFGYTAAVVLGQHLPQLLRSRRLQLPR
jgi:hypothetical protein